MLGALKSSLGIGTYNHQLNDDDPHVQHTTVTCNTGTLSFPGAITKEEQLELDILKEELKQHSITSKLDLFKKLPSELRQAAINTYKWSATMRSMDSLIILKTQRQIELESKPVASPILNGMVTSTVSYSWSSGTESPLQGSLRVTGMSLPEGITLEQLEKTHMEACVEESLCG